MPALALMALLFLFFFVILPRWIRKNGLFRGLYLWVLAFLPVFIWVEIFWFEIAYYAPLISLSPSYLRWAMIWLTLCPLVYFMTRQHGEKRGLTSIIFHLVIFTAGWELGNWIGILCVSLPILAVYYHIMHHLAHAIVPASNPEDKHEKNQRFWVFLWYTWGLQHPLQVVSNDDLSGRTVETRISGNIFSSLGRPGIVWLRSHQAAALTVGINFSRVEGPRVVFTRPYERLLEIVDLRTQIRSREIDAISKDGVRFKATVLASFTLDRDEWTRTTYHDVEDRKVILLKTKTLDSNLDGRFPFASTRVRSALMMRGKTSTEPEQQKVIYWDERVLNQVEVIASRVLSDRRFDELWKPNREEPDASALEEIAAKIKSQAYPELLAQGVRIFAARVTTFNFSEYQQTENKHDDVIKQQIATWSVNWENQRLQILADGDAESKRLQQEARAYVQSVLLTAIAEGMQQTRLRYPNLPRHVIAMRFVGALEELIRQDSEASDAAETFGADARTSLNRMKGRLLPGKDR
jgi:hypothetical protein